MSKAAKTSILTLSSTKYIAKGANVSLTKTYSPMITAFRKLLGYAPGTDFLEVVEVLSDTELLVRKKEGF